MDLKNEFFHIDLMTTTKIILHLLQVKERAVSVFKNTVQLIKLARSFPKIYEYFSKIENRKNSINTHERYNITSNQTINADKTTRDKVEKV